MNGLRLCLLMLGLIMTSSYAAPYQKLDVSRIVQKQDGKSSIDLAVFARAIDHLVPYASDYPPRFDNDSDRAQAIKDVLFLGEVAAILEQAATAQGDFSIMPLNARLYWIGHNLDQAGFAEKADASYAAWLKHSSATEKAAIQEEYGRFLASSAQPERAKPLLQAAYDSGRQQSAFPLGILLLSEGQQSEALTLLRDYSQRFPDNEMAKEIVQAIEAGNYEIKHIDAKPSP